MTLIAYTFEGLRFLLSANDIPVGGLAGFCLASTPMTVATDQQEFEMGFTQKAWNTRSFLVLSMLERRVPGRAHG
jgi:hypothetical protein